MNSVKIPWDDVAKTMGHKLSEGAIVQHLAKIRARRVQAKKEVPPPLKRGACGNYLKTARTTTTASHKSTRASCSSDEEWLEHGASAQRKAGQKRKRTRAQCREESDVEYIDVSDDDDGDSDRVAAGASFLELPNDKHKERPLSATPQPPSKIVTYKCPKPFLIKLAKSTVSRASSPQKPNWAPEVYSGGQLKVEPGTELYSFMEEPVMKKSVTENNLIQMEESLAEPGSLESYCGFPNAAFGNPAFFDNFNYSYDYTATTHTGNHAPSTRFDEAAPAFQEMGQFDSGGNAMTLPQEQWAIGDAQMDPSSVVGIITNSFPEHGSPGSLPGVQFSHGQAL
ncbi:hypothetical protein BDW74DRAFT_173765 [Aspergillus multicolor]|uniref:uncharacterized protein n=1 Tax=Aspergillus multicolor TaxID=41759 RepID=UPI003CCC9501